MSTDTTRTLPARPSKEHLRKEAKRWAKDRRLGLAEAQRQVAASYGFGTWAALIRRVDALRGGQQPAQLPPLAAAARAGDVVGVRRLLAEGASVDEAPRGAGGALWQACASDASDEARLAIVDALLVAGANPRSDGAGETALHAAVARGPLALVERLIRGEALEWQPDSKGRPALDLARAGEGRDKAALAHCELEPIHRLLAGGLEMSAAIAASLGRTDRLVDLLARASPVEVQEAFGLAAINRQKETVSIALDHGADPNGFMPVHTHCLAVHQAVLGDDVEFMELLISYGARIDIPDKLWGSTPLGWAMHQGKARVRAYLESR